MANNWHRGCELHLYHLFYFVCIIGFISNSIFGKPRIAVPGLCSLGYTKLPFPFLLHSLNRSFNRPLNDFMEENDVGEF